jgi:choline dehydrogenase-like flavoprotein
MDTVGFGLSGYIPSLKGMPKHDTDGYSGGHLYIPWWGLDPKNKEFPRGYHVEIGGGFGMPQLGFAQGAIRRHEGYGASLKQKIAEDFGCFVGLSGRGEMIPNEHSFCEIDPNVVDRWGIPVLRFHWKWSDFEVKQAKHMQETFAQLIDAMGGTPLWSTGPDSDWGLAAGGRIIHELGTTRMRDDPDTSVLNRWCQAHEVRNLFVTDGGPFVSQADKNPTWTILALAMRTSEQIAEMVRRREL